MKGARTGHLLARDERGVAMVMGVFFATFLAGAAYYLMGVGDAIIHRQRMQDAADAGAFAAAVMHAHGMNVIALINITMSALLAVLVLLRLMEGLLTIAIAALAVAAFFTAGGTLELIPPLTEARSGVQKVEKVAKPVINDALGALHNAARGVRVLIPIAAEARVLDTVHNEYGDVAALGFALPMQLTLPVTPDSFDQLCGKAGEVAGQLALLPVTGIVPDKVVNIVSDAAESLTRSLSGYFCGGNNSPPSYTPPTETIQLPKLASRKACEDNQDTSRSVTLCNQAKSDERAGAPLGFDTKSGTGECSTTPGADGSVPLSTNSCAQYETWTRTAAQQCDQGDKNNPYHDLKKYTWQAADQVTEFVLVDQHAGKGPEWHTTSELETAGVKAPLSARTLPEWNGPEIHQDGGLPEFCRNGNYHAGQDPVCPGPASKRHYECHVETLDPNTPYECPGAHGKLSTDNAKEGSRIVLYEPAVRRVLGCEAALDVKASSLNVEKNGGITNRNNKTPFKLEDDAMLGEDVFQLRAVVLGKDLRDRTKPGVLVASHGRSDTRSSLLEKLNELGCVSLAQAEYFSAAAKGEKQNDASTRREWMWTTQWRARMRRIWIPTHFRSEKSAQDADRKQLKVQHAANSIEEACQGAHGSGGNSVDTSTCGKAASGGTLSELIQRLSALFIH